MDRPPACYFASVQDGKQEIYLEWPKPDAATKEKCKPVTKKALIVVTQQTCVAIFNQNVSILCCI